MVKQNTIAKFNLNREEHYWINPLQNVHPANIKRPMKLANIENPNEKDDDPFSLRAFNGDNNT